MTGEGNRLPPFLLRGVSFEHGRLVIIDQTRLPVRVVRIRLRTAAETAAAIRRLAVRGAPNIGVAAAYGLVVEAERLVTTRLKPGLRHAAEVLAKARPTAVNLAWAVGRMQRVFRRRGLTGRALRKAALDQARRIEAREIASSLKIAAYGESLVPHGAKVLTICNTGALAAPGMGTALGIIFRAFLAGKRPHVFALETRPLLQGARLTALELMRAGVGCTLIVDSAAASVMERCDLVIVGADRIAANGDFANKVGTRMLAVLAREGGKPFYVAAPGSTFDLGCATGRSIVVEQRPAEEVTSFGRCRVAPRNVRAFNPAFDVTSGRLVTAFVTERGVIRPPFARSIALAIRRQT